MPDSPTERAVQATVNRLPGSVILYTLAGLPLAVWGLAVQDRCGRVASATTIGAPRGYSIAARAGRLSAAGGLDPPQPEVVK